MKVNYLIGIIGSIAILAGGYKIYQLLRFSRLADIEITQTSFKRQGAELHITINTLITNPTEKTIQIRQPYLKLFSKPKEERTENDSPIGISNISDTLHMLAPFQSKAFETITLKVGALNFIRLVKTLIKEKSSALYVNSILRVNNTNVNQEQEISAKTLLA